MVVASSALALAAAAAIACTATESFLRVESSADADADADVEADAGAWGVTECATCVRDRCRGELTRCRSEPTCARHLECVETCPSDANGAPAPACLATCPPPSGSAAERAVIDVEVCRTEGAGVECAGCPRGAGVRRSPLLNQVCETPSWDAGPDATPVQETCAKCGGARCCESRDRCRADPGCFELRDCLVACTDDACMSACNAKYESSFATWNEYAYCNFILCTDECGAAPGRCDGCAFEKCGDEVIGCFSDRDCALLGECIRQCGLAGSCADACQAKYPNGVERLTAQLDCVRARCPACQR